MKVEGTAEDWYQENRAWPAAVAALREVCLAAGLDEVRKWGQPAYTDQGKNVLLVGALKAGATLSFFRGALLEDPEGQLISPGKNSRHARYLLFTSAEEVQRRCGYTAALIQAAVEATRAGLKVAPLPDAQEYAEELQARLDAEPALREAFAALTPGRRRAYELHISQAKRSSTRAERVERCAPRILMGKGLRDCVCGHSARMPRCDGSHKRHPQSS